MHRFGNHLRFVSLYLILLAGLFGSFFGCAASHQPVPAGMIPEARPLRVEDEQYGHQVLQALTERYQLDYNNPRTQAVQDMVDRLTRAARADKDPWHVYILKDDRVKNAAATRGNHVFVWTGMLDAAHSDAELATVLAHEISHILAGHTDPDPNEEVKQLLVNLGAIAAGIAVSAATRSPQYGGDLGNLTSSVTQELGKGLLVYPYSREREAEADQIGLFMMADAKVDPRAAIDFWTKIPHDPDYREGLSFLSSHPPAEDRLQRLNALLPQALARFEGKSTAPPAWRIGGGSALQTPAPSPTGRTSAPAGPAASSADTFALNQTEKAFLPQGEPWQVVAGRAILFQRPSEKSRRLGEFRTGARLNVFRRNGKWLELFEPDHGFLKASDLRAVQ